MKKLLTGFVFLFLGLFAYEEGRVSKVSNFTATDGSTINVSYVNKKNVVGGDSSTTKAFEVRFAVRWGGQNSYYGSGTVVLINYCESNKGDSFSTVYSCNISQGTGGAPYTGRLSTSRYDCDLKSNYNPSGLDNQGGLLISSSSKRGYSVSCTQEIAIKDAREWLVDPASGEHNFKFNMNY